jgi:hypothetical protein
MKSKMVVVCMLAFAVFIGCSKSNKTEVSTDSLSDAEYNSLSAEAQYAVANNLMGTLFKGVPAKDFFNLTAGVGSLSVSGGANFISKTRAELGTPLPDKQTYTDIIEQKYYFDEDQISQQYPLAHLFEFPVSKDFFDNWMAYKLANTILFSPAIELDTVNVTDIQKVLYRLYRMIRDDVSIREIVYEHMISQENWRRFRSPEDNTREMMEIFLARYIDAEVPKAAIACKNWHLTDDSQGYQLVIGFDENTTPQNILDTAVVSCYDFYRAISQHQALIPTITRILVNHFFSDYSDADKQTMINSFVAANPTTFRQLFLNILFSRSYLLHSTRVKWYEETFFNIAHRTQWIADPNFFNYLAYRWGDGGLAKRMKQAIMAYKLGRKEVPLDSLSFAYYHKSLREDILINQSGNSEDRGWPTTFVNDVNLFGEDLITYLFLSTLSRKPDAQELASLKEVIQARYPSTSDFNRISRTAIAMIVLDYCSRLSELYYMRDVQ